MMAQYSYFLKNILLFLLLFVVVISVNQPIISFNMMYQEQASIYLANQTITNWQDLLNIYLHPAWLHVNIPFFRPSGHFLIYQLLMPVFGWHNTAALNIISFTFLTLTGFFIIKLYKLLFPSFALGGYIAFSLYLMHPALSISRLTFMHFDFAYVFFVVFSLYLFILFCQKKNNIKYFLLSLFFYAIAITFKEPAIMLGPVLFCYYCIAFYGRNLLHDKFSHLILFTLTATCLLLSAYLFLAWPSLQYAGNSFNLSHSLGTANALIQDIFGVKQNMIPFGNLPFKDLAFRITVFTVATRYTLWIFFWLTLTCTLLVLKHKERGRKSLLFLFLSSLLFMILPLCWASGAPWHHSLTLICYSLIMGFSAEYFLRRLPFSQTFISCMCILISIIIAWIAVTVNFENTIKYYLEPKGFLGLSLNRNAVFSPPDIKNQLNNDSLIVVEDSTLHNDYFLGNAAYPFLLFFTNDDYDTFQLRQNNFYLKFHPVYSGNLFRYAYLMPSLKEMLYPFQIEHMNDIPNEILYNWLKHSNNIFCLGYDSSGNWYNRTHAFKAGLAKQQSIRHLAIHTFQITEIRTQPKNIAYTKKIPFPDAGLCEYACDQDKQCTGFIFSYALTGIHHDIQCHFRYTESPSKSYAKQRLPGTLMRLLSYSKKNVS